MKSFFETIRDSDSKVLISSRAPSVLHIEINRPDVRNAVDDEVAMLIGQALEAFDADEEFRVAVLSGSGRGFCSGLDLKAFLRGETGMHPTRGFAGIALQPPNKPIIAAVEGFALAGGFELALACDLIVLAEDARVGIPEVKRGLVADGGALIHLPRRVPYQVAMEMALTGDTISAERALETGLVARCTAPGQALEVAFALAEVIATNAPLAVKATKKIMLNSRDAALQDAWERQASIAGPVWDSQDATEGAAAFAEKRKPVFLGK